MATIREMYEKVNEAHFRLPDEVDNIVTQLKPEILELNKEKQLFEGDDNEGKEIGKYKPLTEQLSEGITGKGYPKRAGDSFNMYASGNLFDSIDLIFRNNVIDFFTKTPNHPFLVKNPDKAKTLFGLTKENQEIANYSLVMPKLVKWYKTMLR